ncbi:MAG: M90 family metallopeptidase [Thiohalomonadaceae bacterium]
MLSLRAWRHRRILRRAQIPDPIWIRVREAFPVFDGLDEDEERRLRELSLLFLHEKTLEPAGGLELDEYMRVAIAAQACLPVLQLGLDWYDGWSAVIVYPAEFVPRLEWMDEAGVVHTAEEIRSGEAWLHGPVILSWGDVKASGMGDGYNVVIHEFAHKLDARNGETEGLPPLHRGMDVSEWSRVFAAAFDDLNARMDRGEEPPIDPYAGEAPEEFFAVASEYFFTCPDVLVEAYPVVYDLLRRFYRQDPLARLEPATEP